MFVCVCVYGCELDGLGGVFAEIHLGFEMMSFGKCQL